MIIALPESAAWMVLDRAMTNRGNSAGVTRHYSRGILAAMRSRATAMLVVLLCLAPAPARAAPELACDVGLPDRVCQALTKAIEARGVTVAGQGRAAGPRLMAGPGQGTELGRWHLAVTTSLYDPVEDIPAADLRALWRGTAPPGRERDRLAVEPEVRALLSAIWGPPRGRHVVGLPRPHQRASRRTWTVIPFDQLDPARKVLRVDGVSLLASDKSEARKYALGVPLRLVGAGASLSKKLAGLGRGNRRLDRMTVLMMTGVTALTRKTARLMAARGVRYPARDIKAWFTGADFVHVSNEVSFKPGCPVTPRTMSFCSHPSYIQALEEIRTSIVELTGNHINDKGRRWLTHTLQMYKKRGWRWYGGGTDLARARRPLKLTHRKNRIALLGCNLAGPRRSFATADAPGSLPCNLRWMRNTVRRLRSEGYLPVVTLQQVEKSTHAPLPMHVAHLRSLARAGAVVVQGSQAHQVKPMEVYRGAFIAYGLGNLFFDQVWNTSIRQMMVHRLIFHDGRLLSVEVLTGLNEEHGKSRPTTAAERRRMLRKLERVAREQKLHRVSTR